MIAVDEVRKKSSIETAMKWWQRAVFYEVYVRSFKDTNGDGIGDLNGVTAQLDYLADLGIDAIWLTPFYPSPQVDFGYDISDYVNVDPDYGTLEDFDNLLREAHQRDIKVVCDLVPNHTSNQHPWFIESRSSRNNPKRDWYIWSDPHNGGPPNNWYSAFGPSAWTLDPKTNQYYYHFFHEAQPDLNWRNPLTENAILDVVRFWLNRGVDGFRLDSLNCLFKDAALRDNPVLSRFRSGSKSEREQELKYNTNLPEIHNVLHRLRSLTETCGPERVLIGEAWTKTLRQLARYYGKNRNQLHLAFNFFFAHVPELNASAFQTQVDEAERVLKGRTIAYVLSTHDLPRAYDRYGDGDHNDRIATLLCLMLLTLRGAPFIYYGEEIGMITTDPVTRSEVRDPLGKQYWPLNKGRDGARTPMQWDTTDNAGFTTGTPWLWIGHNYATHNVASETRNPSSILNFYRRAIRLRRQSPALIDGDYLSINGNPAIFAYWRTAPRQAMLVALNMSAETQRLNLNNSRSSGVYSLSRVLDNLTTEQASFGPHELTLAPYEAATLEVHSQ